MADIHSKQLLQRYDVLQYMLKKKWKSFKYTENHYPGTPFFIQPVSQMMRPNYVEMWVESIFFYLGQEIIGESTWVVGGDCRYYFRETFDRVISVIVSHPVKKIIVCVGGQMTGPVMSMLVRHERALGGIFINANFEDAGPNGFIGMRWFIFKGTTAPGLLMKSIHEEAKGLKGYYFTHLVFPMNAVTSYGYEVDGHYTMIMICDGVKMYADYMETIFDFGKINKLIIGKKELYHDLKMLIDCRTSAAGPFAVEIFERRLKCPKGTVLNPVQRREFKYLSLSTNDRAKLIGKMKCQMMDAGFAMDNAGGC